MNEEREKLIEEINKAMFRDEDKGCVKPSEIADFIIADRKRICEPLVKWRTNKYNSSMHIYDVINETLNRAGLGDGK